MLSDQTRPICILSFMSFLTVLFHCIIQSHIHGVLVVRSIAGAGRSQVDDPKRQGINTILQGTEHGSNGLGEGGGAQDAVLADDGPEQSLMDLDELLIMS